MQANRNTKLWQEKVPVYRLSHSKAPKTQQIYHYRHTRKTSQLFLLFIAGVEFSLRNNFANSGSIAKVSFPIHNYNSIVKTRLMSNESDNSAKDGISITSFPCIVELSAICDRVVYQVFCGVVPLLVLIMQCHNSHTTLEH